MSKKKKKGFCTYCLKDTNNITDDHIFPKKWYPKSTPKNMEKWQVPACYKCNNNFSKIENDLLIRFGLCIDPYEIKSLGISDKALRALDPKLGKNPKDIKARSDKRKKILQEMFPVSQFPEENFFPNFGPNNGNINNSNHALLVPADSIIKISKKIVRGLTYKLSNKYITKDYDISIHINKEPDVKFIDDILIKFGEKLIRGPGIIVKRACVESDPVCSLFSIRIWERFFVNIIVKKS